MGRVKLGLIGGNIRASRSPALHRIAGEMAGLAVTYDLLIPAEMGMDLDAVLDWCGANGFGGVNVTYPYKEAVVPRVTLADPALRRLGAVNTVLFGPAGLAGHNTDCTGFAAAFRARYGAAAPGAVAMIGAGGVGRAIAFALAGLGAAELRLVDSDPAKGAALAAALAGQGMAVRPAASAAEALEGARGVINATPVGMVGQPGTPVPAALWPGRVWAFDAVYTPSDTRFLQEAAAAGVDCLSGWELFFHQGIEAFRLFTGVPVSDTAALRAALLALPG